MKITTYFFSSVWHAVQLLLFLITAAVNSFPHQISTPSDKPSLTVECIDTREDFEFHSWVGNPPLSYAIKSAQLPANFRDKFSDTVNGIFYFTADGDESKQRHGHANEETTENGLVNESNTFDFFEYPVLVNENQYQYYNQSIFKLREFFEDKRPSYIYIKYCAFFTKQSLDSDLDSTVGLNNSENGNKQQVVFITPVKGKNQGNLTLTSSSNDLVWREEFFEIDMDQFFGGNEIEISAHNFHSGDFFFIDKLIFVQGATIHRIVDIIALCTNIQSTPMTADISPTETVTENNREVLFSTSLPTDTVADLDISALYSVTTIVPNEVVPASVSTATLMIILTNLASTTTARQTPATTTAATTETTTATTTTAASTTRTTTATKIQAPTTLPATTQTPVKSTVTTIATIITSSPKLSTTELKQPPIDARIIATTESDAATDSEATTEIDENASVTPFDPDMDDINSTTTPTPALLTQDWFEEHEVTFYSVLPSLTLLIILGICFIALRERKKGIYIINKK